MITTTALKLIEQIARQTGHTATTSHRQHATASAGYADGTALIAIVFADRDHAHTFKQRVNKLFQKGILTTNGRTCLVSVHNLLTGDQPTRHQIVTIQADAIRVHEGHTAKLFDIEPQTTTQTPTLEDLNPIERDYRPPEPANPLT